MEMKPWDYWGLGPSLEIDRVKVSVEIERDVDKLSSILERSDVDNVSSSLPPVQEWMPDKDGDGLGAGDADDRDPALLTSIEMQP